MFKNFKSLQPILSSDNLEISIKGSVITKVWFIEIRTTHDLSLWLYEYFWIILLYEHLVSFILKVLAWEICSIKWVFAKKSHIYGSNFYESDFTRH